MQKISAHSGFYLSIEQYQVVFIANILLNNIIEYVQSFYESRAGFKSGQPGQLPRAVFWMWTLQNVNKIYFFRLSKLSYNLGTYSSYIYRLWLKSQKNICD